MLRKRLPYWGSADTLRRMDLDPYVIDVLMPDLVGHDRHPSAFLVYLFLDARCGGTTAELMLRQIAEGTGLSKRSVQAALRRLKARGLLIGHPREHHGGGSVHRAPTVAAFPSSARWVPGRIEFVDVLLDPLSRSSCSVQVSRHLCACPAPV